jgi:hypothetical protein
MHCLRSRDFAATYVYMCRCKWQALWAAHRRARKGGGFDHGRFETVDSAHTPGRNMVGPKSLVAHEDVELPDLIRSFSAHQLSHFISPTVLSRQSIRTVSGLLQH